MAYSENKKPGELSPLTTLANDDVIIVGDTSDASELAKGITKSNFITNDIAPLFAPMLGADDNYMTDAEKTKLAGIEAGAEVNNISDVNATDLTDGGDTTLHTHSAYALSGHNHSGVYEPADATILKSAAIGVSVAAQSHNHTGVYAPALGTDDNYVTDAEKTAIGTIGNKLNVADIDDTPVDGETAAPISSNWAYDHAAVASSDTVAGHVELATIAETNTGSDATRAITPDALAGSYAGTKSLSVQVFDGATDVATGDGKAYITIPESLNGMNLVRAQATVVTAGTTNATTVMIHNKTDAQDMLSGAISIASAGTVGTVGTVNATYDDVATNDVLRIDVDSVSTTAPKGLVVILEFRLP